MDKFGWLVDWLSEKKSWLFDGIGALVLVGLAGGVWKVWKFIFGWWRKRAKNVNMELSEIELPVLPPIELMTNESSTPQGVGVTASQILQAVESVPILQREDIKKHYIGLPVKWKGKLSSISPRNKNYPDLALRVRINLGDVLTHLNLHRFVAYF